MYVVVLCLVIVTQGYVARTPVIGGFDTKQDCVDAAARLNEQQAKTLPENQRFICFKAVEMDRT